MQESKLVKQLKLLEKEEFKGFYLFIRSPFFNQSKEVIRLFEYLRKYYPSFDSPNLAKTKAFKKLFPKQTYSDIKLRNLRSKLGKLVENYLLQLDLQQDDFKWKKALTQIYGKRNFQVEFERGTQQLLETLEAQPYRDAEYFYQRYLLYWDLYLFGQTVRDRKGLFFLKNASKSFTNFYTIEKLRLILYIKNRVSIYHDNEENNKENPPNAQDSNTIISLFENILLLQENNSDALFLQSKVLFLQSKAKLRKVDARDILISLINNALKKVRTNAPTYSKEVFELYKVGIEESILFENGAIHQVTFLNIVIYAAGLNKFDWVENFIKNYAAVITGKNKEDVLVLSSAFYHFHKQNYNKTIELLLPFKVNNKLLELSARTLSIRSYYELYDQDDSFYYYLESSLDSFYKFLSRDTKQADSRLIAYFNFIKVLRKLLKAKIKNRANNQYSILKKIFEESNPIIASTWIKKKIEAI